MAAKLHIKLNAAGRWVVAQPSQSAHFRRWEEAHARVYRHNKIERRY